MALSSSWARPMENSFFGQGNAWVLFLRHFDKGLGLALAHWAFGYALNVRLEKFSPLDACHWSILGAVVPESRD